jgi:hypothetical protein
MILWFSQDTGKTIDRRLDFYILFILFSLILFPMILLKKEHWLSLLLLSVSIFIVLSALHALINDEDIHMPLSVKECVSYFFYYRPFILNYIDVFIMSNFFILLAQSKPRWATWPLAAFLLFIISYIIVYDPYIIG